MQLTLQGTLREILLDPADPSVCARQGRGFLAITPTAAVRRVGPEDATVRARAAPAVRPTLGAERRAAPPSRGSTMPARLVRTDANSAPGHRAGQRKLRAELPR